jgi:hypothetical protein
LATVVIDMYFYMLVPMLPMLARQDIQQQQRRSLPISAAAELVQGRIGLLPIVRPWLAGVTESRTGGRWRSDAGGEVRLFGCLIGFKSTT